MTKPLVTLVVSNARIPVKLADNGRCGGVDDAFVMEAKFSTRQLDSNNYVEEVHALLEEIIARFGAARLAASCESLALGVVSVVHDFMDDDRLERAEVKVHNMTGYVTVEWNKGEEVPDFPREARNEERTTAKQYRRPDNC